MMFCASTFSLPTFITTLFLMLLWYQGVADGSNCSQYSEMSCKDCVEVSGCYYCEPTKQCEDGSIVKKTLQKACEGQEWMVGQCVVSGKVLLIALPVTGFVVLVALICLIYCCCCRRKRGPSRKDLKEDAKMRREREDISKRHKERESERREKRDEIRKKYGIQPV